MENSIKENKNKNKTTTTITPKNGNKLLFEIAMTNNEMMSS